MQFESLKKYFPWLGRILSVTAIIFITRTLITLDWTRVAENTNPSSFRWIIYIYLMYLISFIFVAWGWKVVLSYIRQSKILFIDIFPIFLRGNIAKYIPGSVFEIVTRNYLGNKLGWSLKEITFSSLLEMILSVIAFILLFAIVMLLDYFKVLEFSPIQVLKINYQFIMIGIFVLVFGFLFLKTKIKKIHSIIQQLLSFKFFITIVKFIAIDFILFMIASVSVLMIITNIFNYPLESEQAWNIGISYLVAYVGGYVVFGAPGGIGVRESLFVFLTVGILGSEIPVLAVVLYRMISIFGDITGLLISISIKDKTVKNA